MHGLTFEAHYALVALVSLARHPEGRVKQMREISSREGLPAPFLSKILLKLRHAGIVASRHGRGGGYALSRSAHEITVRDVLIAFGVSGPLTFDLTLPGVTANANIAQGLRTLNYRIEKALQGTSIADLAGLHRSEKAAAPVERGAAAI
ncbi:MAG: Rrf2 family transcriptional regulator [Acidobacteriota bacterium]